MVSLTQEERGRVLVNKVIVLISFLVMNFAYGENCQKQSLGGEYYCEVLLIEGLMVHKDPLKVEFRSQETGNFDLESLKSQYKSCRKKVVSFWKGKFQRKFGSRISGMKSLTYEYKQALKMEISEHNNKNSEFYRGPLTALFKKMLLTPGYVISPKTLELIDEQKDIAVKNIVLHLGVLFNRYNLTKILLGRNFDLIKYDMGKHRWATNRASCGVRKTSSIVFPPLAALSVINNNEGILQLLSKSKVDVKDGNSYSGTLAKILKREKLYQYLKMSLKDKFL
jgi:uncharacterized protein YukE